MAFASIAIFKNVTNNLQNFPTGDQIVVPTSVSDKFGVGMKKELESNAETFDISTKPCWYVVIDTDVDELKYYSGKQWLELLKTKTKSWHKDCRINSVFLASSTRIVLALTRPFLLDTNKQDVYSMHCYQDKPVGQIVASYPFYDSNLLVASLEFLATGANSRDVALGLFSVLDIEPLVWAEQKPGLVYMVVDNRVKQANVISGRPIRIKCDNGGSLTFVVRYLNDSACNRCGVVGHSSTTCLTFWKKADTEKKAKEEEYLLTKKQEEEMEKKEEETVAFFKKKQEEKEILIKIATEEIKKNCDLLQKQKMIRLAHEEIKKAFPNEKDAMVDKIISSLTEKEQEEIKKQEVTISGIEMLETADFRLILDNPQASSSSSTSSSDKSTLLQDLFYTQFEKSIMSWKDCHINLYHFLISHNPLFLFQVGPSTDRDVQLCISMLEQNPRVATRSNFELLQTCIYGGHHSCPLLKLGEIQLWKRWLTNLRPYFNKG